MPGYIWDPKNGAVPESSLVPVEKKRKELLSIPTTQNVMPGSASSAAAFSQYIPRVNSTVGSDLAHVGSLLVTPMLGVGTKAAANVLELTSPSHWVGKAAARLAFPTEKALKYGRMADIIVPATASGFSVGKGFVDLSRAEMSKEKENAWKEIAGSGTGLFAGLLAAPVGNSIVRRIRKVKNLARLDNAGTIGGLNDVGKNLAEYNAAIGERPAVLDRMKRTKINTRVKPNSVEAMASYGRDPNNFGNIVKINPESSAWGLGPEYADALIAHEAEHAVLDAYGPVQFYPEQVTRRPQLQVPDGMKFAPNTNNPLYGELKVLSDVNNGHPWYSNPEEVAAETAFLRQLTGQNKNYSELPGFYQKRFRNYIGDQFFLTEPEAHQVLSSLSGKYDYGGLVSRLKKHYGSNEKALEAVRKFAGGGDANAMYDPNGVMWSQPKPTELPEVMVRGPYDWDAMKLRQYWGESRFRDNLTSPAGAKGAFQIMPITQKDYILRGGAEGDLMDRAYNEGVRDDLVALLRSDPYFDEANTSPESFAAMVTGAYNIGRSGFKKRLKELENHGYDIRHSTDWVDAFPVKETRNYMKWVGLGQDVGGDLTSEAFDAAVEKNGFKSGGKIHIAPSKRGTFTAAAKKHGKSVQAFASQVLAHKENYSPAMVKKANFARNARKFKHGDGGIIDRLYNHSGGDVGKVLELIQKARSA